MRERTAALPSAKMSSASGVEHPRASEMGNELLLFLNVLGRGLEGVMECRLSIVCPVPELVDSSNVYHYRGVATQLDLKSGQMDDVKRG